MFLAGGIGITPFLSIVRQADHDRLPHKLHLFFIFYLRPEDTAFLKLSKCWKEQPKFSFDMHHDQNAAIPKGMEGGNRFDQQEDVVETSVRAAGAGLLQCWSSRACCGISKMLIGAGVDEDDIRTEDFAGY